MDKLYNVGYLGAIPGNPDAFEIDETLDCIGIRTYNSISVDKVIDIVQHTHKGVLDDKLFGLKYDRKCKIIYSGRAMMDFSPSEFIGIMKDINLLIVSACIEFEHARVFLFLLRNQISSDCIVVLRIPFSLDELPKNRYQSSFWLSQMRLDSNHCKSCNRKSKSKKVSLEHEICMYKLFIVILMITSCYWFE
jgi:hypothetical protein